MNEAQFNEKIMKYKIISIIFLLIIFLLSGSNVLAQNENKLDYGNNFVVDSDLDGLTDLGEKEIYRTDPQNPDTDGDGILDGAEAINATDPLNNASPSAVRTVSAQETLTEKETPWAWYVTRASGLMAYFLLWWVMFLGLAIRTPILKNILKPIFSLETHAWLSVQALVFVFFHSGALLWDKYLQFQLLDLIVPFHSETYTSEVTLGILGLYLMVLLILSSYFRKFYSHRIWRAVHFINIALFAIVTIHAFFIGTDLKSGLFLRDVFMGANALLFFVIIVNLAVRLKNLFFTKNT